MPAQRTTTKYEMPQELVTWQAPLRKFQPKNKLWFVGLLFLAIAIFVVLVIFKELLLGLVILAIAFYLFTIAAVKPPVGVYGIMTTGVQEEGKIYLYDDLESFFIDNGDTLVIKTKLSFPHELALFLGDADGKAIQETLINYLPYISQKRTDYLSIVDGFIGKFSQKLPEKMTRRVIDDPNTKVEMGENWKKDLKSFFREKDSAKK